MALALAQEAVAVKVDRELSVEERVFLYMPFMHSESPLIHETAERLFRDNGIQNHYDFELKSKGHHRQIRPLPTPQRCARSRVNCRRGRVLTETGLKLLALSFETLYRISTSSGPR